MASPCAATTPATGPTAGEARLAWLLFAVAMLHRLLQWWLLQPPLHVLATANADFQVMQVLPRELWRNHFAEALLYLQQTPPLPNLIFGAVTALTADAATQATVFILLEGLMHAAATALLFLLLMRLRMPVLLASAVTLLFVVSADFIVMEYMALGQLFYEPMSMLLCLLATCCAASISRQPTPQAAFALGLTVACLALTRASFSYFAAPALFWLLLAAGRNARRAAICLAFVLPLALLQGGWAMKQALVQGEFQWATSSWGGINLQAGDLKRFFARMTRPAARPPAQGIDFSALASRVECLQRWRHIPPMGFYVEQQLMAPHPDGAGPSPAAIAADQASAAARGMRVSADSAITREYSACLQRAYLAFWREHPVQLLISWWQSYGMFWAAIRDFAEIYPLTLVPEQKRWSDPATPRTWQPAGNPAVGHYLMRQDRYPGFFPTASMSSLRPVTLLALPVLPPLMSFGAMVVLHAAPLLYAGIAVFRRRSFSRDDLIVLFLALTCAYVAFIANIGEHGENMRFRVAIEPLAWIIALRMLLHLYRARRISASAARNVT